MYLCMCHRVKEADIIQAARDGSRNLRQLRRAMPVANGCCRCTDRVRSCLQNANAQLQPQPSCRALLQKVGQWFGSEAGLPANKINP